MIRRVSAVIGAAFVVVCAHAQIQTAGDLLLNIDPSSLSALSDGTKVNSWINTGTLGGEFFPAVSGEGALYQTNVLGVAAVTFSRSQNTVMTSAINAPSSILSNNIWSAELWILNPTLETGEDQLAWTDRGGWVGEPLGQCMEFRYCSDPFNCVEHYGLPNIPWSGNPAVSNLWHHLAITRAADGTERLYADGVLRTTKQVAINLRAGSTFKLGGVRDIEGNSWTMLFSGSLGAVRVHDGTLSAEQVANNYQLERATYYQLIWSGASGASLPWNEPANWINGVTAVDGDAAWIDNGGTALLTNDLSLVALYAHDGGLTISNGAVLTVDSTEHTTIGVGAGSDFNLKILDGMLLMAGSRGNQIFAGRNGGRGDIEIGGIGSPALLELDQDLRVADGSGSVGRVKISEEGVLHSPNGWMYAARDVGSDGEIVVDGGTISFGAGYQCLSINYNGGHGVVVVNNGRVELAGDLLWSHGTATNVSYGALHLNGGVVSARRFYADTTAGINLLYLNGGVIQAQDSRADFLYNLTTAYVQSSGAIFDTPAGIDVIASQSLTEDAANPGGGLTKTGAGSLTLSGVNAFTGPVDLQAGTLLFSNTNGLPTDYAGTITVANGGVIGYAKPGGATQLLTLMETSSVGTLTLFKENAAADIDFSLFPGLVLSFVEDVDYTGAFIPYDGQYLFEVDGVVVTNASIMADAALTPGYLEITGFNGGRMILNGNSTFTGGAVIDGASVVIGHVNALGVQDVPGTPDVELRNGAALIFETSMDIKEFVNNRLKTASNGILLIGAVNAAQDVDISRFPGIVIGTAELSLDYTGTITPAGTTYQLGGGTMAFDHSPNRGLSVNNLIDQGSATAVVIGTPGMVELKTGNSYSGGTVITNGGILFIKEDGLGAVPTSPDPDNLYVDDGVIRSGNTNFTLNANRGLTVASGGLELHPWALYTMTVAGDLSGSGPIKITDGGMVAFAGDNNSYSGSVTINSTNHNIRIGDGASFSWGSTGGIMNNGTLYLRTDLASSFGDSVSGKGSVRKEGSGTLTLTAPQSYTGTTYVDAGVLRVDDTDVLSSASMVQIAAGAAFDTDGLELVMGGLSGIGNVINTTGAAGKLMVGGNNANAIFAGEIDGSLTLTKIGGGTQTLSMSHPLGSADVLSGTLDLFGTTAVTGAVAVADGAILNLTYGDNGLIGEYYDLNAEPVPADFASLSALETFLTGKTPALVVNSIEFGATFNAGSNGAKFPGKYNVSGTSLFAVRWTGEFFAEVAGTYTFATASDDGSLLFIDGAKVVDNNSMHAYIAGDRTATRSSVELSAGMHEIVIVFYENSGDQGVTVWVELPGDGFDQELPNNLLFSGPEKGSALVESLSGVAGSKLAFGSGASALTLTGDDDMTFDGAIMGANRASSVIKTGSGALTLRSGVSDHFGVLDIQGGTLVLTNGAGMLGTLAMADGVTTEVSGSKGLVMEFYHRSVADSDYSEFQSLDAWEAYLTTTFPNGADNVYNSSMLGANLDTGATGTAWPDPYKYPGGSHENYYDSYWYGSIYLSDSGLYTFATASDDGSCLFIDRELVVANAFDQGVIQRSGTITLDAGFHDIAIPYRENTGGNALRVYIAYPGGPTNLLPQSILIGGAGLRGLAGAAGSELALGATGTMLLDQMADTTHAGEITGGASTFIQKMGAATLTLTAENTLYNGAYTIAGGALRVGDGGASGALGINASAFIASDGTLIFDRTGTVEVGAPLSGTGLIRLDGPGEVYLTANGSFAGLVEVNNGRLTFAPGVFLGLDGVISNTAVVEAKTSGTTTFHDTLTGMGDFEVTGSGTLRLADNNSTFAGATRIDTDATLQISQAGQLGGGGDVVLDGGALAVAPVPIQGTTEMIPALTNTEWTINGSAVWATRGGSQWVQLTPNLTAEAGSTYCNTKMPPGVPWYASFRYEVGDKSTLPADGMAFVLQNDSRGTAALGAMGGALGVKGVTPSIGIYFNLYKADSIGWIVDGEKVDTTTAINGLNLTGGVDAELYYDGEKMVLTVSQDTIVYTVERAIDLAAKFGTDSTWVGFSGGTGGATAQQFVGEFSMMDAATSSTVFANTLVVEAGAVGSLTSMLLSDDASMEFAGADLGSGALLNITSASGSKADVDYVVAVSNLTVGVGMATVNVAANGSGVGVLGLENLYIGSGALLTVIGGVCAPSGSLTVMVPTPVPDGITLLGDFTGATWVGAHPDLYLVDENGDPIDATLKLLNGKLYINTVKGTLLILR